MKQSVFWQPTEVESTDHYVVLTKPSGETIADSIQWCNDRLGPSSDDWGYFPYGPSFRDIAFFFNKENIDTDMVVLFKLTWCGA